MFFYPKGVVAFITAFQSTTHCPHSPATMHAQSDGVIARHTFRLLDEKQNSSRRECHILEIHDDDLR